MLLWWVTKVGQPKNPLAFVVQCFAVTQCLSNHLCVNHIIKILSPSGFHTILVVSHQTLWQYSVSGPPNGGVEWKWGLKKSPFSTNILSHCTLSKVQPSDVVKRVLPDRGKLATLIGSLCTALEQGVHYRITMAICSCRIMLCNR